MHEFLKKNNMHDIEGNLTGPEFEEQRVKIVYIIAWLTIVIFLGWSGNLLLTIQNYWSQTSIMHDRLHDLSELTNRLQDLNRPGNDVLENYEVAENQAAYEHYLRQFQVAFDNVSPWVGEHEGLEPLIQQLVLEQATLSSHARETLEHARQREQLREANADPSLISEHETLAAASMARMDQAFQNSLNIVLNAKDRVLKQEEALEGLHRNDYKQLYVMLLATLLASALCMELIRRIIRQREALRDSSARINAIMDNVVDGIVTINASGRIESANSAAASMFGYSHDELVGTEFLRLIDAHCYDRYRNQLRDSNGLAIASIDLSDCENPGRRKGGSSFPIELAASHFTLQGKTVLIHIMRDVTARKHAEAHLRQAANVIENITEGILVTNARHEILSVNPAFTEITQYTEEEVIGKNPRILQSGNHDQAFYQSMWASIDATGQWQGEIWNRRKNGETYPQWLTISAIRDDHGRISNYIGVTWDITELKASEHMKEEFITTVSHELRTPLTSVLGSLGLLIEGSGGQLPEKGQKLVQMAYSNSGRLVRLVRDILDFEKMSIGKMNFQLSTQELMPLVQQTIESNSTLPEETGISIELLESLPGVRVNCDAERLMQALTNLLSNAVKFSPANSRVEVRVLRQAPMIRIMVTDYGPGIPEDLHDEIFEKFTQAGTIPSQRKGGIGLGLSIAKLIIEQHDGRIDFESGSGLGTMFFIELPEYPVAASRHRKPGQMGDRTRNSVFHSEALRKTS